MAKDSSIIDYDDLDRYAKHLQDAADNLADTYNSIRRRVDAISNVWDDKNQMLLKGLLDEESPKIYDLSQAMFDHGSRVIQLNKENRESDDSFARIINH